MAPAQSRGSQFNSEWSKFGAPEEIRTPDSQIRSSGPSTLNARGSRSDHNFLRRATLQQNHGPILHSRGSRFLEIARVPLWPVACTCRHRVGPLKPASRTRPSRNWPVFQGFDLPRSRNGGNLGGPRAPIRVSTAVLHRPNPVARETPGFIGFFARRDQVAEREGLAPLTPML
jgi:hypothetical protein